MDNNKKLVISAILALIVGVAAGYYYGNSQGRQAGIDDGITQGRQQILDEQEKKRQEELAKVADEANIFNDIEDVANPFKDTYKNPFAQ